MSSLEVSSDWNLTFQWYCPSRMEMLPSWMLLLSMALASMAGVAPMAVSFSLSGIISSSGKTRPLRSTMATSGICSMRLDMTLAARRLISITRELSSTVMLTKKAGMSVALDLMAFGLSVPSGRDDRDRSILSLTSTNVKSMSVPYSNDRRMMPTPLSDWDLMSVREGICISSRRRLCRYWSISLAELPSTLTCTVICGMSTSGMSETGISLMDTAPKTATAKRTIDTATGRFISFLIIVLRLL